MNQTIRNRRAIPKRRQARVRCEAQSALLLQRSLLLAGAVAVAALASGAFGQDGDDSASTTEVRNCVDLMSVERTRVVDDDTVLFFMRNGDVYRNELRHRCPTLGSEERFMYRTALNQLCDIDVITVLQDVGFGFMPTASCGLGKFQPIDEDAAAELVGGARDKEDTSGRVDR